MNFSSSEQKVNKHEQVPDEVVRFPNEQNFTSFNFEEIIMKGNCCFLEFLKVIINYDRNVCNFSLKNNHFHNFSLLNTLFTEA